MIYSDKPWPGNCNTKYKLVLLNKMTFTNYLWVLIICGLGKVVYTNHETTIMIQHSYHSMS